MKSILYILSILTYVYLVLASADLERCRSKCSNVIIYCNEVNHQPLSGIPMYPILGSCKREQVCKCYCENEDNYHECLDCYFAFQLNKKPTKEEVHSECVNFNRVLEQKAATKQAQQTTLTSNVMASTAISTITNNQSSMNTGPENQNQSNLYQNGNVDATTQTNETKKEAGNKNKTNSNVWMWSVIGGVAAAGVIGFFVYSKNKKSRPESMPFYGNTVSSPSQYATLDPPKNNLTMSYNNNQTVPTLPTNNQYYNQNTYNYNQAPSSYDQYNQYQSSSDYQYTQSSQTYNTLSTSPQAAPTVVTAAAAVNTATNNQNSYVENSISYDARRESMNQSQSFSQQPAGTTPSSQKTYTCTYPYEPKLDDELELKLEDKVQILEEFEDGWMKALNLTTGKEGMAPMVCVKN